MGKISDRQLRNLIEVDADRVVRILLESELWLSSLDMRSNYNRTHDDCDGDFTQQLHVMFGPDGDAWLSMDGNDHGSLRFRNWCGGGLSLNTYKALSILALAIRLDNEQRPMIEPEQSPDPAP